jgi:hypothetical protein
MRRRKLIGIMLTMLALAAPVARADDLFPVMLERGLRAAVAAGDPGMVAALAGANPKYAAQLVAVFVSARPDLAVPTAKAAATALPDAAPSVAQAAVTANPADIAAIVVGVSLVVPAARSAIIQSAVEILPEPDRLAASRSIDAAIKAVKPPSLEDPS